MKALASVVSKGTALIGLAVLASACGGGGSSAANDTTSPNSVTFQPTGSLQFSASTYTVGESQGSASIKIARTGGSAGALSGTITTTAGTATTGQDFTATTSTINFADGDTAEKTVNIPIFNDPVAEASETFTVTLASSLGGGTLTATVTIQDDDRPGTLQLGRASYSVGEGGGSVDIEVERVNGSAGVVGVSIATQNGTAVSAQDFTALGTTLSFAAGDATSKTLSIPITSDGVTEADETFTVVLSSVTGGATLGTPATATVTIVANDQPPPPPAGGSPGNIQLSAATLDVDESGSNAVMTVSRVGGSVGTVSVRLTTANGSALAGQDYTSVNQVVTFAAGDTTDKFINVPISNDAAAESAESFTVTLSTLTGGATFGTPTSTLITIQDNDPPPAPTLTLTTDIQRLHFGWTTSSTVTAYKLYANPDGISGFTQVGVDFTPATTSLDIDVVTFNFNWNGALYRLEACNDIGCTGSASVGTLGSMLSAIGYFKGQAVDSFDQFGASIALSGDGNTLVVGVPSEDSAATTINGNSANNGANDAGAAYVFAKTNGVWARQAYLKASNAAAGDRFGAAVSITNGGNTVAVGAPNRSFSSGAVYVFTRSGTTWSQQGIVTAPNSQAGDNFGASLSLNSDATWMVVGAPNEASNATNVNGSQSDNSATGAGAAYVFSRSGSTWSHHAYLKASNTGASDAFGAAVAMSGDGLTVAVGATGEDSDGVGVSGASNDNASGSGAVYVFARSGLVWAAPTYIKSGNSEFSDQFGASVSLSSDGNTLAIGAPGEDGQANGINGSRSADALGCLNNTPNHVAKCDSGAVYVLTRTGGVLSQQAYVKSSNSTALDNFGGAIALSADGNSLIAGAINEDSSSAGIDGDQEFTNAKQSGAAYLFSRSGSTWTQRNYFKATNPNTDDVFGTSVAINANGTSVAVGAPAEDSNAVDIGGDRNNNTLNNSGAAYLY